MAGKVTMGLAEDNGRQLPVLYQYYLLADLETRSALCPTLDLQVWDSLPFYILTLNLPNQLLID